jgi:hypothetical protein
MKVIFCFYTRLASRITIEMTTKRNDKKSAKFKKLDNDDEEKGCKIKEKLVTKENNQN